MRWFLIMLVLGTGLIVYKLNHRSAAYEAYLRFDEARREGKCERILPLAQGAAQAWATAFCAGGNGGDALSGLGAVAAGNPDSAMDLAVTAGGLNTLQQAAGIVMAHKAVSEDKNDDGSITLVALSFPIDRHNDPANRRLMTSHRRHTLRLLPSGEGFKILDFKDAPAGG